MKLTADTITDEQIRELRDLFSAGYHAALDALGAGPYEIPPDRIQRGRESLCDIALNAPHGIARIEARARLAEILNARQT